MNPLIFIVEDDLKLARMVEDFLDSRGFRTITETDGVRAIERIVQEKPDLVILDVMLPSVDGLTVCRRIRSAKVDCPVLMLTARSGDLDEIEGLEDGADDYVRKPARPRVLLARIQALLRRHSSSSEATSGILRLGRLIIDPASRVASLDRQELTLSTSEFELLHYLAKRAGTTVSREDIYRDLRGIEYDGMERSVDLRISRLRQKLLDTGERPKVIKSIRGVGYQIVEIV